MTVFLSILNKMDFHMDQNRKENCHNDHISFNMKGNRILVFQCTLNRINSRASFSQKESFAGCSTASKGFFMDLIMQGKPGNVAVPGVLRKSRPSCDERVKLKCIWKKCINFRWLTFFYLKYFDINIFYLCFMNYQLVRTV